MMRILLEAKASVDTGLTQTKHALQTPLHRVCYHAHVCMEELGLKWVSVGTSPPEGSREIRHSKLAQKLRQKITIFSPEEFAELSVPTIKALWEEIGSQKPETGNEIICEALATALKEKTEFEADEITFEVPNLTYQSYIKVNDDKYFQPASNLSSAADSCHHHGGLSSDCYIKVESEYFVPAGAQLVRELLKNGADIERPTKTSLVGRSLVVRICAHNACPLRRVAPIRMCSLRRKCSLVRMCSCI